MYGWYCQIKWTELWLLIPQWGSNHQVAIYRNWHSYFYSSYPAERWVFVCQGNTFVSMFQTLTQHLLYSYLIELLLTTAHNFSSRLTVLIWRALGIPCPVKCVCRGRGSLLLNWMALVIYSDKEQFKFFKYSDWKGTCHLGKNKLM